MSSNLDTAILLGKETTYGTPVALTDAYEGKADSWKRENEYLDSIGFRAGDQAMRSDRRTAINMGGAGSLEFDILNKGAGFLLQALLGTVSGPTQEGATAAYTSTHTTASDDPGDSYTVQVQRVGATSGTIQSFTHHGCKPTGWTLSQEVGGYAMLNVDFDFEDVETATANGTPAYPASASPFDWTQALVEVNSTAVDVSSLELSADLNLKTDRRFLRNSALKKEPCRQGRPTFNGTLAGEFLDSTLYDLFVAGTIVPIVFTWAGAEIESPHNFELKVTMAACQLTGESPEASIDDLPSQPVTFDVLHNGTDPAILIEYKSTDVSL